MHKLSSHKIFFWVLKPDLSKCNKMSPCHLELRNENRKEKDERWITVKEWQRLLAFMRFRIFFNWVFKQVSRQLLKLVRKKYNTPIFHTVISSIISNICHSSLYLNLINSCHLQHLSSICILVYCLADYVTYQWSWAYKLKNLQAIKILPAKSKGKHIPEIHF